jgi:hypothetical protein
MLRLGNYLFRKVVDSHTGEKSIWNRENPTDRGQGTVATVGVVVTPAPTSNVTVLSEDEKWQWGMLASCSLKGYLASKVLLVD